MNGARIARPISVGDLVRTPLRREAVVISFIVGRASCRYLDDCDEVILSPELLLRLGRADDATLDAFGID